MKKILTLSLTILLLLTVFVSCAQDNEAVFKSIVHSSPKSKYGCLSYAGQDSDSRHYVLTKNQGVISFKIDDNHKATDLKTVDTGIYKAINYVYVTENWFYGLDNSGVLFCINLTDNTLSTIEGNYTRLSSGYAVTTPTSTKGKTLCKLNGTDKVEEKTLPESATVVSVFSNGIILDSTGTLYALDRLTTLATGFNDEFIVNVITNGDNVYITLKTDSDYYFVYNKNLTPEGYVATLNAEPTASFISGDYIIYKTLETIDQVDTKNETVTELTTGWATNLYTDTTEINEFIKIGDDLYSLNGTGGMLYITEDNAVQIFSE